MPTCFACGSPISKGQNVQRLVYTGSSVGGFNLSTNVLLNWALNSALSKRKMNVRSYYSLRSVCQSCASRIDQRQKDRMLLALKAIGIILVCTCALLVARLLL
jgi:hypothetical protein